MPKLHLFVEWIQRFAHTVHEARYLLVVYALAVLSFWVVVTSLRPVHF